MRFCGRPETGPRLKINHPQTLFIVDVLGQEEVDALLHATQGGVVRRENAAAPNADGGGADTEDGSGDGAGVDLFVLTNAQSQVFARAFTSLDTDGNGLLSHDEMRVEFPADELGDRDDVDIAEFTEWRQMNMVPTGIEQDEQGVHHITVQSPLNFDECFGWCDVYADKMDIVGRGGLPSRTLAFPERREEG